LQPTVSPPLGAGHSSVQTPDASLRTTASAGRASAAPPSRAVDPPAPALPPVAAMPPAPLPPMLAVPPEPAAPPVRAPPVLVLPPVLVVLPPLVVVPPELIVVPPLAVVAGELVVPPVRAPPVLWSRPSPWCRLYWLGCFPRFHRRSEERIRSRVWVVSYGSFARAVASRIPWAQENSRRRTTNPEGRQGQYQAPGRAKKQRPSTRRAVTSCLRRDSR